VNTPAGDAPLEGLRAELETTLAKARDLFRTAGADRLRAAPRPGAWSPAQCLVHLNLSTAAYLPSLERALAEAPPRPPGRGMRQGLAARLLRFHLEPPARLRSRTVPRFQPPAADPDAALAEFERLQAALFDVLDRGHGKDLGAVSVPSPFAKGVGYSAYGSLRVLAAHQRRHLWQAGRAARGEVAG
jgi:hypothetical protein